MSESRSQLARVLLMIGRIALAVVFLYAAYAKLKPQIAHAPWTAGSIRTSLAMFALQVDSYQLLSPSSATFVAQTLPFFELFLGIWLLSGLALRLSSVVTTLLLGGFFGLMVRTFAMGIEVSCGCFGPGEKIGAKTLTRDGSLLTLALAVTIGAFLIHRSRRSGAEAASTAAPANT
jgi:uncharacterized membrane protein YphA (DoxX/SURF4 family)